MKRSLEIFLQLSVLLILASQRIETLMGKFFFEDTTPDNDNGPIKRGELPSIIECFILAWVFGEYYLKFHKALQRRVGLKYFPLDS